MEIICRYLGILLGFYGFIEIIFGFQIELERTLTIPNNAKCIFSIRYLSGFSEDTRFQNHVGVQLQVSVHVYEHTTQLHAGLRKG